MLRKILCAHDLSESSDPALRVAVDLAEALHAELTVLFAAALTTPVPPSEWFRVEGEDLDVLAERLRSSGEAELTRRVGEVQGSRRLPITVVAATGEPGDIILETGQRTGAGVIVMGTHGRKGWQHLLIGSVAERVVRTAPVPVMTVGPRSTTGRSPAI